MTRKRFNRPALAAAGAALALLLGSAGPASAHNGDDHTTPPAPGAYTSKAQAIEANLHDLPVGPLTVANWPAGPTHAVLAGSQHVVDFGILESNANGSYVDGWVSADTRIAGITGGINGLLSIDLGAITSECRSDASGQTGSSSVASGSISILGYGVLKLPLNAPPNTTVSIPGLLDVTLNRQVHNADGSLTVTAIDIHGTPLLSTLLLSMHPLYLTAGQTTCDQIVPELPVPAIAIAGDGAGEVVAGGALAALAGAGVFLSRRRRTSVTA